MFDIVYINLCFKKRLIEVLKTSYFLSFFPFCDVAKSEIIQKKI
jgi:hypothetical protein